MATKESKRVKKYNPKAESKGGRLSKERKAKILDEIQDYYLRYGSINKLELARRLKVNRGTIISIINEMDIEMESLPAIKIELKLIFERIKNRLMFLWDKLIEKSESTEIYDIKSELMIIKEMKDTIDNFYKLLQEFGEAPKQAENINLQADVTQRSLSINLVATPEQLSEIQDGSD